MARNNCYQGAWLRVYELKLVGYDILCDASESRQGWLHSYSLMSLASSITSLIAREQLNDSFLLLSSSSHFI